MPQGLIRIVLPLLMVLAFLLFILSVGLEPASEDAGSGQQPNAEAESPAP